MKLSLNGVTKKTAPFLGHPVFGATVQPVIKREFLRHAELSASFATSASGILMKS